MVLGGPKDQRERSLLQFPAKDADVAPRRRGGGAGATFWRQNKTHFRGLTPREAVTHVKMGQVSSYCFGVLVMMWPPSSSSFNRMQFKCCVIAWKVAANQLFSFLFLFFFFLKYNFFRNLEKRKENDFLLIWLNDDVVESLSIAALTDTMNGFIFLPIWAEAFFPLNYIFTFILYMYFSFIFLII